MPSKHKRFPKKKEEEWNYHDNAKYDDGKSFHTESFFLFTFLPRPTSGVSAIQFSAMNKENKNRIKLDYRYEKHFLHRRSTKILNNKKWAERNFPFEMHYTLFNSKPIEKWKDKKLTFKNITRHETLLLRHKLLAIIGFARHGNAFNMTLIPSSESIGKKLSDDFVNESEMRLRKRLSLLFLSLWLGGLCRVARRWRRNAFWHRTNLFLMA